LFKLAKYSSIIFFLGKYKSKLFRVISVLLFAGITSLLYADVADYLQQSHPETVIYALIAKIFIVYGSLGFVLWQFRPDPEPKTDRVSHKTPQSRAQEVGLGGDPASNGPLSALEDVAEKEKLRSRYDGVLEGNTKKPD
jgi:hypothetical protein